MNPTVHKAKLCNVLMVGCFPDPITGMSLVNRQILEALQSEVNVKAIDTANFSSSALVRYFYKLKQVLYATMTLIFPGSMNFNVFYMPVDDKIGVFLNIILVLCSKLKNKKVFLHYHSYRYIERKSLLIKILCSICGSNITHVFLCKCMQEDFFKVYGIKGHFLISPNIVDNPNLNDKDSASNRGRPLTVGMLSNLTFEKGVKEFVDLLYLAKAEGSDLRGVLAGPAIGRDVEKLLQKANSDLGEQLVCLGHISGSAKNKFFSDIDVFLFPTHIEALPLVLLEACVRGVPFIANDRGCIRHYENLPGVKVLAREKEFVSKSFALLKTEYNDRAKRAEVSELLKIEASAMNEAHVSARRRLISAIASGK